MMRTTVPKSIFGICVVFLAVCSKSDSKPLKNTPAFLTQHQQSALMNIIDLRLYRRGDHNCFKWNKKWETTRRSISILRGGHQSDDDDGDGRHENEIGELDHDDFTKGQNELFGDREVEGDSNSPSPGNFGGGIQVSSYQNEGDDDDHSSSLIDDEYAEVEKNKKGSEIIPQEVKSDEHDSIEEAILSRAISSKNDSEESAKLRRKLSSRAKEYLEEIRELYEEKLSKDGDDSGEGERKKRRTKPPHPETVLHYMASKIPAIKKSPNIALSLRGSARAGVDSAIAAYAIGLIAKTANAHYKYFGETKDYKIKYYEDSSGKFHSSVSKELISDRRFEQLVECVLCGVDVTKIKQIQKADSGALEKSIMEKVSISNPLKSTSEESALIDDHVNVDSHSLDGNIINGDSDIYEGLSVADACRAARGISVLGGHSLEYIGGEKPSDILLALSMRCKDLLTTRLQLLQNGEETTQCANSPDGESTETGLSRFEKEVKELVQDAAYALWSFTHVKVFSGISTDDLVDVCLSILSQSEQPLWEMREKTADMAFDYVDIILDSASNEVENVTKVDESCARVIVDSEHATNLHEANVSKSKLALNSSDSSASSDPSCPGEIVCVDSTRHNKETSNSKDLLVTRLSIKELVDVLWAMASYDVESSSHTPNATISSQEHNTIIDVILQLLIDIFVKDLGDTHQPELSVADNTESSPGRLAPHKNEVRNEHSLGDITERKPASDCYQEIEGDRDEVKNAKNNDRGLVEENSDSYSPDTNSDTSVREIDATTGDVDKLGLQIEDIETSHPGYRDAVAAESKLDLSDEGEEDVGLESEVATGNEYGSIESLNNGVVHVVDAAALIAAEGAMNNNQIDEDDSVHSGNVVDNNVTGAASSFYEDPESGTVHVVDAASLLAAEDAESRVYKHQTSIDSSNDNHIDEEDSHDLCHTGHSESDSYPMRPTSLDADNITPMEDTQAKAMFSSISPMQTTGGVGETDIIIENHIRPFSARELSVIAWSVTTMKKSAFKNIMPLISAILVNRGQSELDSIDSDDIANLVWAFAKYIDTSDLKMFGDNLTIEHLEQIVNWIIGLTLRRLEAEKLGPYELSRIIWSISTIHSLLDSVCLSSDAVKLVSDALEFASSKLDNFTIEEVSRIVWGFSVLWHDKKGSKRSINNYEMFGQMLGIIELSLLNWEKGHPWNSHATSHKPNSALIFGKSIKALPYHDHEMDNFDNKLHRPLAQSSLPLLRELTVDPSTLCKLCHGLSKLAETSHVQVSPTLIRVASRLFASKNGRLLQECSHHDIVRLCYASASICFGTETRLTISDQDFLLRGFMKRLVHHLNENISSSSSFLNKLLPSEFSEMMFALGSFGIRCTKNEMNNTSTRRLDLKCTIPDLNKEQIRKLSIDKRAKLLFGITACGDVIGNCVGLYRIILSLIEDGSKMKPNIIYEVAESVLNIFDSLHAIDSLNDSGSESHIKTTETKASAEIEDEVNLNEGESKVPLVTDGISASDENNNSDERNIIDNQSMKPLRKLKDACDQALSMIISLSLQQISRFSIEEIQQLLMVFIDRTFKTNGFVETIEDEVKKRLASLESQQGLSFPSFVREINKTPTSSIPLGNNVLQRGLRIFSNEESSSHLGEAQEDLSVFGGKLGSSDTNAVIYANQARTEKEAFKLGKCLQLVHYYRLIME